ncbi:MAG: hypothetical protein ACLSHO_03275 [Dysosmobacter sp.]
MGDTQWENCGAETLLEEFFAQDDLRQLAESAGKILDCPLLVLDDTFHVAAYRLPQGFSDELFQNVVSCGEITYEAGVLISEARPFRKGGRTFYNCRAVRIPGGLRSLSARGSSLAASSAWTRTDIWKNSRSDMGTGGAHPRQAVVCGGQPAEQAL